MVPSETHALMRNTVKAGVRGARNGASLDAILSGVQSALNREHEIKQGLKQRFGR
jgi:hypothetical protein